MEGLNRPEKLNIKDRNVRQLWKVWRKEYLTYLVAANIPEEAGRRRVALKLNFLGGEAEKVFDTFVMAEGKSKENYKDVLEKFDQYCLPRVNLVYERHNFFKIKQGGVKAEAYFSNMMEQAQLAHVENMSFADSLRTVFVAGMDDKKLQKKLLKDQTMTLDATLQELVMAEDADKSWEGLNKTGSETVAAVNLAVKQNGEPKPKQNTGYGKASLCGKCALRHGPKPCPASQSSCNNCSQKGHYMRCCPDKRVNLVGTLVDEEPEEEDLFIGLAPY